MRWPMINPYALDKFYKAHMGFCEAYAATSLSRGYQ